MTRPPNISRQTCTVLAALLEQPQAWRYGYDLSKETGLKSGTLYPLLIRLSDQGLLEAEWRQPLQPGRPARHAYRLTEAGTALARRFALYHADRKDAPGDGPTEFDAASGEKHSAVETGGMSTTDQGAIIATMKAMFDKPEAPLTVDPVVVDGDHALASWAQGDKGGRALLERRAGVWQVILCGGPDLRMPAFLAQHGVTAAETLSQMFNAAEDGLGADKVALSSSFEGVVMITEPASE